MKKQLLTILLFSIIHYNSYAQSPTDPVNNVVDNIADRINDIINKLDDVVTRQSFDIRQHLLIVLGEVDWILGKNIDKVFGELSEVQKEMLLNTNSILTEIETKGYVTTEKLEELVDKATAFAGTLPGSKKKPTITKVNPSFVIVDSSGNVTVTIKGSWLAHGKPHIVMNSIGYEPIMEIDNQLKFNLPLDLFVSENKTNFFKADLILYHKKFLKKKILKYKIGLTLLPKHMGTYTIFVKTKESKKIETPRRENFSISNGHCQGGRDYAWTFNAQSGDWKIDPKSIKVKDLHVSTKSRFHGSRNVGEKAFQLYGRVENNGSCIRKWGVTVAKDGRGVINGRVDWTEYLVVPEIKDLGKFISSKLYWDDDVVVKLPENVESFRIELDQINKKKSILTGTGNEKWYQVVYDKNSKEILIKPRTPNEALREN